MSKSEDYCYKAHKYIPSGAHTYSRSDEVFPGNAPKVIEKSKGVYFWDMDGNKYLDYAMACRSVTIGYDYTRISEAAIAQIHFGNTASKASKIEVDAAEAICKLIPWVEMVKFAKNGSTVTTAAIKLARAYTGRKYVARCYEHSFFSYDDWFIGDTEAKRGIPFENYALTLNFHYNDILSVEQLFEKYKGEIACLIMEPCEFDPPKNDFLKKIRSLCNTHGVVLIFDEMITGFRWDIQGASKYYNVVPDLVTYGKGMANGFSVAALGGKKKIMELGASIPGTERVFLISTTHGAEMSSLGAFVETLNVYSELKVTDCMWKKGQFLCDEIRNLINEFKLSSQFKIVGEYCSPNFVLLDKDGKESLRYRTVFCQEMMRNKVLMPYISLAYQHSMLDLEYTLNAVRKALVILEKAYNGNVDNFIEGNIIKPVFRKWN